MVAEPLNNAVKIVDGQADKLADIPNVHDAETKHHSLLTTKHLRSNL